MPDNAPPPARRTQLPREIFAAGAAITALAAILAQPAVMSMAGLDISRQRAFGQVDPLAVGSIAATKDVHGLAGVLKPLRMKD